MAVFHYQQNTQVLEPVEYVALYKKGRRWLMLGNPCKTYSQAVRRLIKSQRLNRLGTGKICVLGAQSTQTYSRTTHNRGTP